MLLIGKIIMKIFKTWHKKSLQNVDEKFMTQFVQYRLFWTAALLITCYLAETQKKKLG